MLTVFCLQMNDKCSSEVGALDSVNTLTILELLFFLLCWQSNFPTQNVHFYSLLGIYPCFATE